MTNLMFVTFIVVALWAIIATIGLGWTIAIVVGGCLFGAACVV